MRKSVAKPVYWTKYQEISLRDIVKILQPENSELLDLIDRNLALHKERAGLALPLESGTTDLADRTAATEESEAERREEDELGKLGKGSGLRNLWSRIGTIPTTFMISLLSLIVGTLQDNSAYEREVLLTII